jgi:hypothetical protein
LGIRALEAKKQRTLDGLMDLVPVHGMAPLERASEHSRSKGQGEKATFRVNNGRCLGLSMVVVEGGE